MQATGVSLLCICCCFIIDQCCLVKCCIDPMHSVVSLHQDRHLLPQSGGGRSEEDHRPTAGADRKCETSAAHIQMCSLFVIIKKHLFKLNVFLILFASFSGRR